MRLAELFETRRKTTDPLDQIKKLADDLGVELDVQKKRKEIHLIWIDNMGGKAGSGASVMQALCDHADHIGAEIVLQVWQGEPGLIAYYQRFGFQLVGDPVEDDEPLMARAPKR